MQGLHRRASADSRLTVFVKSRSHVLRENLRLTWPFRTHKTPEKTSKIRIVRLVPNIEITPMKSISISHVCEIRDSHCFGPPLSSPPAPCFSPVRLRAISRSTSLVFTPGLDLRRSRTVYAHPPFFETRKRHKEALVQSQKVVFITAILKTGCSAVYTLA